MSFALRFTAPMPATQTASPRSATRPSSSTTCLRFRDRPPIAAATGSGTGCRPFARSQTICSSRSGALRQDAVLVETSAEMSGRASGAEVDWRFWTIWRVRDGLITYHHGYSRREDAVADLESG
jgi:hypothetical protein